MFSFLRNTLLALAMFHAVDANIKDCSSGNSLFDFTDLALKPDPPVPGQQVAMTVRFRNEGGTLDDGTVTTSITLNFIPFTPSIEPLCTNTKCPILNGLNDRSTIGTTPSSIQGKVVTKIVWTAVNGSELLCIQTTFSLGAKQTFLRTNKTKVNNTEYDMLLPMFRSGRSKSRKLTYFKLDKISNKTASNSTALIPYKRIYMLKKDSSINYYNSSKNMCFPHEAPPKLVNYSTSYPIKVNMSSVVLLRRRN
jgi:hypothetical protein